MHLFFSPWKYNHSLLNLHVFWIYHYVIYIFLHYGTLWFIHSFICFLFWALKFLFYWSHGLLIWVSTVSIPSFNLSIKLSKKIKLCFVFFVYVFCCKLQTAFWCYNSLYFLTTFIAFLSYCLSFFIKALFLWLFVLLILTVTLFQFLVPWLLKCLKCQKADKLLNVITLSTASWQTPAHTFGKSLPATCTSTIPAASMLRDCSAHTF